MATKIGLFDVDTQVDFMEPAGALYVPGAEHLKNNLARLVAYARRHRLPIVASVDAHVENDPEFTQFPPHCRQGTPGQAKIPETAPVDPAFIENRDYGEHLKEVLGRHREVVIEKQTLDVFTNPNTEHILRAIGAREWIVCGVATDYCVKNAVLGLRRAGYAVKVVEDAIAAVNLQPDDGRQAIVAMQKEGAKFISTGELLSALESRRHAMA